MTHQTVRVINATHELVPLPVAVKTITIADTAGTLEALGTFTFDPDMRYAQIAIEGGPVRTDPSGNAPTASNGQPVIIGQVVQLSRAEAKLGKWIRSTTTSATAQISQYGG